MFEQHTIEFRRIDYLLSVKTYACADCKALTSDPEGHNHWHDDLIKEMNKLREEDTT